VAAVTPSPKSESNASDGTSDTRLMPTMDDGSGAWRMHGKLFRANIVRTDEINGGNAFALSNSCSIERYYRVADRVLEQFLSSNIAERNELIESYLIGNRLFKFLSIVLPTHHQYFSLDQKLEELRHRSESQLMELLDYIEGLELMIDEMEYNGYILNDLTPSQIHGTRGGNETLHITNEMSSDDGDINGGFLEGSSDTKQNDNSNDNDNNTSEMAISKIRMQTNQEGLLQQKQQLRSGVEQHSSQNNNQCKKFQGGNVKVAVQAIEASYQKQKQTNDLQSQHEIFKERVAAVLTANSSVERSNNSDRSVRSICSGATKYNSLFSRNTNAMQLDFSPEKSQMDANKNLQECLPYDAEFIDDQGLFQVSKSKSDHPEMPKKSIEKKRREKEEELQHESPGDSFSSWNLDFSDCNAFLSDAKEFEGFEQKKTHIDLLLEDPPSPSPKQKQTESPKLLPKIKEPPVSYPRSIRVHAQAQAARLSPSFELTTELSHALSDCSSDIFNSLEDHRPKETARVKTRIEKRIERAMTFKRGRYESTGNTSYEDSSLLEGHPQRKLLDQFRGCVRSLLD